MATLSNQSEASGPSVIKSITVSVDMVAEFRLLYANKDWRVSDVQYFSDGRVRRVKIFERPELLRDGVSKWLYPNGSDIKLTLRLAQRLPQAVSQDKPSKNATRKERQNHGE